MAAQLEQQQRQAQEEESSSGEEADLEAELDRAIEKLEQQDKHSDEKRRRRAAAPAVHHSQDQRSISQYAREILQANNQHELADFNDHYQQAERDYQQLCLKMQEGVHGLKPSKQQFAAALVAVSSPDEKIIMHQPPGTGKTRTLIAYIYLYAQRHADASICLRFPSLTLKQQDEPAYDILTRILPAGTRLQLEVGVKNLLSTDWVQVLDEADHFLLDADDFDKTRNAGWRVFGLTATPIKREGSMEEQLMDLLGYQRTESCILPVHGELADLIPITA